MNNKDSVKKISTKEKNLIKKIVKEFLALLGIKEEHELSFEENTINLILDIQDKGVIIGYHGEVLDSLQLIFSLIIAKKINRFIPVSIEVGDYKKNRIEFLKGLTLRTKEKVLQENKEFSISGLKSWERRIVHLFLQDDQEVMSESTGEGKERTLIIKPRE